MGDREVTVLDIPVMGEDREQVATLVERLRGRRSAADYAQRHHAATIPDHVTRYRDLAARGVRMVFLALPDLAGPDEVSASSTGGRRIPMSAVGDGSFVAAADTRESPSPTRHLSGSIQGKPNR